MFNEGKELMKTSASDPMDVGTNLKVKFRTGDVNLQNVGGDSARQTMTTQGFFKCISGSVYEDQIHVVAESPCVRQRETRVYFSELGKIKRV